MGPPGLLLVYSAPKAGSSLSLAAYHGWYNQHLRDILSLSPSSQPPATALRYRRTTVNDAAAHHHRFLALYPLPDVSFLRSEAFRQRPMEGVFADIDFDARVYEEVQRFVPGYGDRLAGGQRGVGATVVGMTPGGGGEGEREFDDWYRKQHCDMLSMVGGYLRTTRYKFVEDVTKEIAPPADGTGSVPKFLAIHEYDTVAIPAEQVKKVIASEWSTRMVKMAERFEREIVELIHEEVTGDREFATLHS